MAIIKGRAIAIEQSPRAMLWRFVLAIAMSTGGFYMALPNNALSTSDKALLVGSASGVLFAICAASILWRLVSLRGTVLTVDDSGIRDLRVARELIPWQAVQSVSPWRDQSILVVKVEPSVEATLALTVGASWTRQFNKMLGADGLCITSQGLKVTQETLIEAIASHTGAGADHKFILKGFIQ